MDLSEYIEIASSTDVGRRYDHNEDSISSVPEHAFVILADGMGGHNAGEVASAMAVDYVTQHVLDYIDKVDTLEMDAETGLTQYSDIVREAVQRANFEIFEAAKEPKHHGMGTTIVVALMYENQMTVANVGDSRLYRYVNKSLKQVTKDHTLLQELVDQGFYTLEEAREAPNKNIVTRGLGAEESVEVDVCEEYISKGEKILLCSDGLTDMLEDDEILAIMNKYVHNNQACVQALINSANEQGGLDNVSAIIVEVKKNFPSDGKSFSRVLDWLLK